MALPRPAPLLALALALTLLAGACGTGASTAIPSGPAGASGKPAASSVASSAPVAIPGASADAAAANPSAGASAVGAIADRTPPNGATSPVDDASWALADRLTAAVYTADTTLAMQTALAAAGIAVVADTSTDPTTAVPEVPLTAAASPFELLDFQAHALAVGAWAGATWSGAELDGVLPLPDGSTGLPSTSALLAAYVGSSDSPGAAFSRAMMAGQDLLQPASLQFPAAVLVLFASDLATDGGRVAAPRASPSPGGALLPAAQLALAQTRQGTAADAGPAIDVATICSGPSGWIDAVVARLKRALELATPDNLPGVIVVRIFSWFIDIGAALVKGLLDALTGGVVAAIRSVAAVIAGVAIQIASLLPYAVKVTAVGGPGPTFTLGGAPLPGEYAVQVTAGDLPTWPAVLSDCARGAQIDLPDFRAKPAPVTFGPLSPTDALLSPTDQAATTATTDATGYATWPFLVARDPGDPAGTLEHQIDRMPVAVHRPELDQARSKLTDRLLAPIPDLLRPFVAAIFKPLLDGLQGRLNAVLDARGTGIALLVYHAAATPTPIPSQTPTPSSACGVSVPAGSYSGTFTMSSKTIVATGAGVSTDEANGPFILNVAADGSLTGSFSYIDQGHEVVDDGPAQDEQTSTTSMTGGTASGTLCSLVLAFGTFVVTSCHDKMFGDCSGGSGSLAGRSLPMGPPSHVGAGQVVWQFHSDTTDAVSHLTSAATVSVSAP